MTPSRSLSAWRLLVVTALGLPLVLGASAAGAQQEPRPGAQAPPTKKAKKEKKKEIKLTAEQKKRMEMESSGRTALQWYEEAVTRYRAGKYLDSRSILLPLEDSARAIDIQEQVKLLIADTYFAQGGAMNLAEALARYKSFSTFFPSSEHAEYVQFQIARSYYKQLAPADRDQSFTDSVIAEYERFLALHPGSERAGQAKRELAEARILRARAEFEVAQFYWDWKDYRGAATRLETVLRERPELPEREQALYLCAQAHYNIGQRAVGDSFAARLEQDYPGSTWKAKLDAGAAGGQTIEQQVRKEQKASKQSARTASRQAKQDRRATKQVRKDSGLPANVPGDQEVTRAAPAARQQEAAASGGEQPAPARESSPRSAEAERRDAEKAAQLEAEEQQQAAKQAEQAKKREEEAAAEAKKAEEKAAKEQAKRDAMSEEEKARRAEKEAKDAAAAQARADKLEAEEAAQATDEAARQKKKEEKEAAEAKKKAEKKAKKAGGK